MATITKAISNKQTVTISVFNFFIISYYNTFMLAILNVIWVNIFVE